MDPPDPPLDPRMRYIISSYLYAHSSFAITLYIKILYIVGIQRIFKARCLF